MHLDEVVETLPFSIGRRPISSQVDGIVAFNALLSRSMLGIHRV